METTTGNGEGTPLAQLRAKLGQKAKLEPKFRFYTLYHHIYRDDVLQEAWSMVKRNGGAAGYDGVSIKAILTMPGGAQAYLKTIQEELRTKRYYPSPVKRVYIPKGDGKQRPLGIPTVKDRIVQTAALLILEPIFEADFLPCSFGFRPGKSAHQAVNVIRNAISEGKTQVYDADLKGYFDSIPHDQLMKCVEMRVVDSQMLKLIRKWLEAPIWEPGKPMNKNDKGTPQGGIISPLLANLYLHWFDKRFHGPNGPRQWANAVLVRYADDFVVLARYMTDKIRLWIESELEGRFNLVINREKTTIVNVNKPKTGLNFLGFTLRNVPKRSNEFFKYCLITPSKKSLNKARESIREKLSHKNGFKPIHEVIKGLNTFLEGWGNYFSFGNPSKAFDAINTHTQDRLYNFLQRRSQRGYKKCEQKSWYQTFKNLGLRILTKSHFRMNA